MVPLVSRTFYHHTGTIVPLHHLGPQRNPFIPIDASWRMLTADTKMSLLFDKASLAVPWYICNYGFPKPEPKLRLLRLPLLAFKEVILSMDLDSLINLSLCSSYTAYTIKLFKRYYFKGITNCEVIKKDGDLVFSSRMFWKLAHLPQSIHFSWTAFHIDPFVSYLRRWIESSIPCTELVDFTADLYLPNYFDTILRSVKFEVIDEEWIHPIHGKILPPHYKVQRIDQRKCALLYTFDKDGELWLGMHIY